MPLQLKYRLYRTYLRVEIRGSRTPGSEVTESMDIWGQIADLCNQFQRKKILAVMKISGRLPLDSAFKIAKSAEHIGWSRSYKLAVVAPSKIILVNIQFSETILINLGYDVKMFSTKWRAKRWLLSEKTVDLN